MGPLGAAPGTLLWAIDQQQPLALTTLATGAGKESPPAGLPLQTSTHLEYFKAVDVQHPNAVLLIRLLHGSVDGLQGEMAGATFMGRAAAHRSSRPASP